jgi:EAL domain-containing protein (putative c-di-GMP-specific phosphodiesterase class I)/FixJ family two-component response regulator
MNMRMDQMQAQRGTVLLVDDEEAVLRAHSRLLRQQGFTVETLSDGSLVLSRVAAGDVDVVVTDLRMQGVDGIEVLKSVRAAHPDVPVVLLTGSADIPSAVKAVEHGALRYLEKPVGGETLAATADEAVRIARLSRIQRQVYELYARNVFEESELEVRFAAALRGVRMAYQRIVRAGDESVYACEALVRTSEETLRRPDHLFAAAERVGGLRDLGRAIRDQVAGSVVGQAPSTCVFVNLHPLDLDDPDLYDLASPLTGVASQIVLEITERHSLDGMKGLPDKIRALRSLGFRIALDDLGAGYAGLTSFTRLGPDIVKLDMALVRDIHSEPTKRRLVESMVRLCHDLGILVVAEGVETEAERDVLVGLGCDFLQGYLFGRPE